MFWRDKLQSKEYLVLFRNSAMIKYTHNHGSMRTSNLGDY